MARLRNRMLKADFWNDPELLRWPRDKRWAYQGLWETAEDSGCLEDDPFGWKLLLFPSPLDGDITVELFALWRDELVDAGKMLPYEADGKRYLWLKNFHQHEHPKNPQSPNLPLPPWVSWRQREVQRKDSGRGGSYTINEYVVDTSLIPSTSNGTVTIGQPDGYRKETPVRSCPDQSSPAYTYGAPQSDATPVDNSQGEDAFADVDFGEEEPEQEEAPDNRTPAQQLVAFYVEERTKAGSKPTDRQRGIVADVIGQKVRGGSKPESVREAIRRMIDKGKAPSMLPAFVDEVEAERRAVRPRSTVPEFHEPTQEERAASLEAARKAREQVAAMAAGIGMAMP